MNGWNPSKVEAFSAQFQMFLDYVYVNSKEKGKMRLGDQVYFAQQSCLDQIYAGLAQDKHWFDILKSRQLGISTLMRALSVFWLGIHDGLKGYSILDTDPHKEEARLEILFMMENLPPSLKFPVIKRQNRYLIELSNGSLLNFAAGGVKRGKGSGTLGRSSGVNFCHVSEMCSIDNPEGIESFKNSLAEDFENRLYLWESTARGFNLRHEMWEEARADPDHKSAIFIGWWAKDNQRIPRDSADFAKYGVYPLSDYEREQITAVKNQYGFSITDEQLAWYRRKMDPAAESDGDLPPDFRGDVLKVQEQPFTAEEAFQQTGSVFFQPEDLTEITKRDVSKKFSGWSFSCGAEFVDSRVYPAHNVRSIEFKVWEEPVDDGVYVISADPAYGHDDRNDRSALQVLRCYADGLDQVAEYAWPMTTSRQFAWVIASIMGWYGNSEKADIYLILEINGPGEAVWNEMQSLKKQVATNYQPKDQLEARGLRRMFFNVKHYMYSRPDSVIPGRSAYHWKSTGMNKIPTLERLRDFVSNRALKIRSLDTIEEMRSIAREGDSIAAQGTKKDDRVISLALGVKYWEDRVRPRLMTGRRTREAEAAKSRLNITDQTMLFQRNQLQAYLEGKSKQRQAAVREARREAWRRRR